MKKILGLYLLIYQISIAAPYPVTGSSIYLNNKLNLYLWPFKFDLNLTHTNYEVDLTQNDSDKWTIKAIDPEMQIYVRVRQLGPKDDYDKSLKNWLKEYEKSGFQIVGQQILRKNAEQGWIHLQDTQTEKQLVQYFRYENKNWIYFNCVGTKEKLTALKKACEDLNSLLIFR